MQNLPTLDISNRKLTIYKTAQEGDLDQTYKPFRNLESPEGALDDFNTDKIKFDVNHPLDIEVQPSYDGSVNLIINDDKNPPLLINSRFSVQENKTYIIPDHAGENDTNIYSEDQVELDTRLYKTVTKIPKLEFLGLSNNGNFKCGTYHFYFKYSDVDNNETDFITESGIVTCHIGNINTPSSIRMGMQDENSNKSIKFKLSNIDTQYDLVKIYYTRTTSDISQQDIVTANLIDSKFVISDTELDITLTGFENTVDISINDINLMYELADSVKCQAQCQNMLFFGNINKPKIQYKELEDLSLRIIPEVYTDGDTIGNLDFNYVDRSGKNSNEYYNAKNLYYNLGYWPEEYYRIGVVYILKDYTLSPVFNIRGLDLTAEQGNAKAFAIEDIAKRRVYVEFDNKGYIIDRDNPFDNTKGVIKLPYQQVITSEGVKPLGLKFNISSELKTELDSHVKGFFFVRQKRIPTILAQGCAIGKTRDAFGNLPVIPYDNKGDINGFLSQSRYLEKRTLSVVPNNYEIKAMIVPEAELREAIFNQIFTSSTFNLTQAKGQTATIAKQNSHYYLIRNDGGNNSDVKAALLTMVNDNMKLTTNGTDYFSARAGEAEQAWEVADVVNNWRTIDAGTLNASSSFVRGSFGTYVGVNLNLNDGPGAILNIRPADYSDSLNYKTQMFETRFFTTDSYYAISDRLELDSGEFICYRGDCFIGNFTHRMQRNFIDPELPTNNKIVDVGTWAKNFKVAKDDSSVAARVLFNYKQKDGDGTIMEPGDAKYDSAGGFLGIPGTIAQEDWKVKGAHKINRADVNAVPMGTWFTFKVMSNVNVSMRDIDLTNPSEQSIFNKPRGFFPLNRMTDGGDNKLPDSTVINGGANVTLSQRYNFLTPSVPFLKNKFDTRLIYSDIHITDAFTNGYRVFRGGNYRDLPKTYGALVSLKELNGNLIAIMENGVLLIPVNERALAGEGAGGSVYINTANVLPENPRVLSNTYGSIWKDSIIQTGDTIYGVDTVAKKIWKVSPNAETKSYNLEIISDLKVQKFLNDNINLTESDKLPNINTKNVKTHYNAFKGDVMFTFNNEGKKWNLCYNEKLNKFITFYSWLPVYSENINNIFFSFKLKDEDEPTDSTLTYLWKHGQAGNYNEIIKPTKWYDKQEPFEFEFVMADKAITQKIFDNLKIISNKTKPNELEFDIVGESYDWFEFKKIIYDLNDLDLMTITDEYGTVTLTSSDLEFRYSQYLSARPQIKKIPYIERIRGNGEWEANSTNVKLIKDDLLNEERIRTYQLANDIKVHGRLKGNIQYLEDLWNVEIRPINFEYAHMKSYYNYLLNEDEGLMLFEDDSIVLDEQTLISKTMLKQSRLRDKYLRIRVKYSGEDLAVIQALKTFYTISYT
jgi:hypothetical protein